MTNEEGKARARAEAALGGEWGVVSASYFEVVLREAPAEPLLVRKAWEGLARHADTVIRMRKEGWTIGDIHFSYDGSLDRIEARGPAEGGYEVTYSLRPEGDEWDHSFDGFGGRYGAAYGVSERGPAGGVASPEEAWQTLAIADAAGRRAAEREIYGRLLAECGPGQEPDPDEVCELLATYDERGGDPFMMSIPGGEGETFVVKRPEGRDA